MTGTAVAAVAMAALTGSQAPGPVARASTPEEAATSPDQAGPGDTHYYRELPPLGVRHLAGPSSAQRSAAGPRVAVEGAALPATVLDAYRQAQEASSPRCGLRWELLAAIGQVESGQARGGRVDAKGTTYRPIIGPQLNGEGFALIRDSDSGVYDGDAAYDHAVGPMQFIPSTWARWGADGNDDGRSDPHNVYDAALAAAHYLCAGGRDLSRPQDLDRAVLAYNRSTEYLNVVLSWYAYFRDGGPIAADRSTPVSGTKPRPRVPEPATPSPAPTPPRPASPPPPPSQQPTPKPKPTPKPTPKPSPSTDRPPLITPPTTPTELPDGGGILPTDKTLTGNG